MTAVAYAPLNLSGSRKGASAKEHRELMEGRTSGPSASTGRAQITTFNLAAFAWNSVSLRSVKPSTYRCGSSGWMRREVDGTRQDSRGETKEMHRAEEIRIMFRRQCNSILYSRYINRFRFFS